jgi:hypothetical protein
MKNLIFFTAFILSSLSNSLFAATPSSVVQSTQTQVDSIPPEVISAAVMVLAIPGAGEAEAMIAAAAVLAAVATYGVYTTVKSLAEALGEVHEIRNFRGDKCPGKYRALYVPNANPALIKLLDLIPGVCTEPNPLAPQDWYVVI